MSDEAKPVPGPDGKDPGPGQSTVAEMSQPPSADEAKAQAALQAFLQDEKKAEAASSKALAELGPPQPGFWKRFFQIRNQPKTWERILMGCLFLVIVGSIWTLVTRPWYGPSGNERLLNVFELPSPEETFGSFHTLWFDMALTRNLVASIGRVLLGFGLAAVVGVFLGIFCGAFRRIDSFFAPFTLFGRNVPVVALVPLFMGLFGSDERMRILFLFFGCVAFVMFDTTRAIAEVEQDYLDTAYTLGANRWQTLFKVVVPVALPDIMNSIRLLIGLAFGYIVLVETIVQPEYGAGKMIANMIKRGIKEPVPVVLILLAAIAWGMDRLVYLLQRWLFSYRYSR